MGGLGLAGCVVALAGIAGLAGACAASVVAQPAARRETAAVASAPGPLPAPADEPKLAAQAAALPTSPALVPGSERIDWSVVLTDPHLSRNGLKVYLSVFSAGRAQDVAAVAPALGKVDPGGCAAAATYDEARAVGVQKVVPLRYLVGHFSSAKAQELLVELDIEWCNQQMRRVVDKRLVLHRLDDNVQVFDVSRADLWMIHGLMDFDDDGLLEALAEGGNSFAPGPHRLLRFTAAGLETLWLGSFVENWKACERDCCDPKRLKQVVGLKFHQTSYVDAEIIEELWEAPCSWRTEDSFKLLERRTSHFTLKDSRNGAAP